MKTFKIIFLFPLTFVVWSAVNQYFFCPSYHFVAPKPFEGSQLYNPYAGIDSGAWYKCNFHAHSNAWNGLTNGEANASTVWKTYDSLGYSVHCVSEYQKVDTTFSSQENYVPAYEHGYNPSKTHQLVLGDHSPSWLDYLFPQTLSNKQRILNMLKQNDSDIVILNHPQLKKGYHCDELRYLTNYQCMEVLNPSVTSFPQWDAALSAGNPVFIVGDDDVHHINDLYSVGKECTWLNMPSLNRHNVLTALRKGQGYAMHVASLNDQPREVRINRLKNELPSLKAFSVSNDSIHVSVSKKAKYILFIGQEGKQLNGFADTTAASYAIKKEDHYVRSAIIFEDSTAIFLNPVFRYSGDPLHSLQGASVNHNRTVLFFLLGLNIILIWLILAFTIAFAKKGQSNGFKLYTEDVDEELIPALP